jgi:DNA (cytosine-5)-methyltransferase 1
MGLKGAYYNENNPYAAQWLRNLISAGLIVPGDVDDRSIAEIAVDDLGGYAQHHFFAGLGGWSYALRLAGWPNDEPVWTGSCPCQPFSVAGRQLGFDDERHLWPVWFKLIQQFRPAVIFGEQVEAAIRQRWLDSVFIDLEGEGYACGAAVLPACGVGAPHIRQRLWFVADPECGRRNRRSSRHAESNDVGAPSCMEHAKGEQERLPGRAWQSRSTAAERPCGTPWSDADWLPCTDGKARPVEPGTFPLAHGIPKRVGRLRAYGNAIVPQVAAEFIKAASDAMGLNCPISHGWPPQQWDGTKWVYIMGLNNDGSWDGVCACGKSQSDGVRCRFGATHKPPPPRPMPWETEPRKDKMPWEP